ncbi:MAG: VWA domain-containing protein, partial [Thiogranum sp.]
MLDSFIDTLSLSTFGQFHFLRPGWVLALVPILVLLVLQFRKGQSSKRWHSIIVPHLLEHLVVQRSRNRWFNPFTLLTLLMILFVLVLMGPSWSRQPSPFLRDAASLVVVLDVSQSMLSEDIQPSRLERSKQKISDLLDKRSDSRNSLVVFSGSAHTVLPPTNDADILKIYLKAVTPKMMPRQGKFPEKALPLLDKLLKDDQVPGTVLLVTDGISADSQADIDSHFAGKPWQLLVLGVGKNQEQIANAQLKEIAPLEEKA